MVELLAPERVRTLQRAPFTYAEVGATAGTPPAGYHHQDVSAQVGTGSAQFEAAAETLLSWRMHEAAGLGVRASDLRVRPGSVAVLRMGLRRSRLAIRIPVRVLRVVDEERRRGFVYGTLPGHPEQGEESFMLTLADSGAVVFDLVAFSRGDRWFTTIGAPWARAAQYLVTERYVGAIRHAASAAAAA